jgi:hypothetical protein
LGREVPTFALSKNENTTSGEIDRKRDENKQKERKLIERTKQ